MASKKGNWFGNNNIKGYLFFLLFTTIVAIFIKLANTYEGSRDFQVQVEEVPDDLVINPLEGSTIAVNYESNGFVLVRNSFRESVIKTPFSALKKNDDGNYMLSSEDMSNAIERVLGITASTIQIMPEQLLFSVNSLASKDVPVVAVTDIKFETGFGAIQGVKLEPEFVKVIGSQNDIDSIKQLFTKRITLDKVSNNVVKTILIDDSKLAKEVVVNPKEIKITLEVEKFTEGSVVVPVTLVNGDNRNIQLFPKEVTLFYAVPISKFETVKASDFVVEATTSNEGSNDSHLALEVTKKSDVVSGTRLSLNQVQYVIVNE